MMNAVWVWGAIGLILLAMEMASGTFYMMWLGVSAMCVALMMWQFPATSIALQLIVFALLSLGSLAIWKMFYKRAETHHRVGQAQGEEIGRVGTIVEACEPNMQGKILFGQGLMGSREWPAVADTAIAVGTQAKVVAVEGNYLRVQAV